MEMEIHLPFHDLTIGVTGGAGVTGGWVGGFTIGSDWWGDVFAGGGEVGCLTRKMLTSKCSMYYGEFDKIMVRQWIYRCSIHSQL